MVTGSVFEIKRFAVHDGPGIRTTVFFKGCPLSCVWCHNPEGIAAKAEIAFLERKCEGCGDCFDACPRRLHSIGENGGHNVDRASCVLCGDCVNACMPRALKLYGKEYTPRVLLSVVASDMDFFKRSGGGVTCSGGEPLSQPAFVAEFLGLCKEAGIHTAVDTSGYAPWSCFESILKVTDIFLFDIKHMDPAKHKELTGADNRLILDNLRELSKTGVPIEIRIPVLPLINDGDENIALTAELLKSLPSLTLIRPLPYHALSGSKYAAIGRECHMPGASGGELAAAVKVSELLRLEGLPVVPPD